MHSAPMETSVSELNALQAEFRRVYGPHFEDLPNKENTVFIFVQQGFENVAVMMDYILGLGIQKEHVFMTTKPHTSSGAMREHFRSQVGHYIDFQWDASVVQGQSHYSQKTQATCQCLLNKVMEFLNAYRSQQIEKILVLDEGGRFLRIASNSLITWRNKKSHLRKIIAVEHTRSGTHEYPPQVPFPYILMADCFLKTQIEAQYVADGVIEASRAVLEERVDDDTVFGVIGCGNVGSHVIELLREEYPDKKILVSDINSSVFTQIKINELGWQDEVERVETNQEVFARAVLVFGCTGHDITKGLSRGEIAGNAQQMTLISASSGDREYLSLLIHSPDYKFDSPEDFKDVSIEIEETHSSQIIIHNGGFPVNFSPNRQYGIPLDKVGITLAMKYAAVAQAFELFNLFKLSQQHTDPQKREWLIRYMMLDPRMQQIILENFQVEADDRPDDQPLSLIANGSYGDRPMTREQITGEMVLTELLSDFYQDKGTIPLMFHEIALPMDKAFIRLRIKSNAARQAREGYWPLGRLFEATDPQTPIRHIVIEGEPGVGKSTLSQFIGFACFNRNLYEQVASKEQEEGAEEYKGDRPTPIMPASPLLKEVNQWSSVFKGVIIVRLRDLNNFAFDITQVDPSGNDPYPLAQYQLAEFILKQHNLHQQASMGSTLKERAETLLGWLYSTEANKKPRDHYLLVLDGYDELTGGMYQDPSIEGHTVLRELLNYPFWLLTSRPKQVDDAILESEVCDRHLDLAGFAHEDVDDYVKAVIPLLHIQRPEGREETPASEKVDSLLEFLAQRPSLKQLARVPICCQLLCYLWNDAQARLESIEPLTPALLYKEMVILLAKRARRRQAGIDHEVIDREMMQHNVVANYYQVAFSALAELSFAKQKGEQTRQLVVSEDDLNNLAGIDGVRRTVTQALHLLNPTHRIETQQQGYTTEQPEQYEFTHLSFQEFLAANYLVKQLASDDLEVQQAAKTFIIEHKYEQHHRNMLGYASSIIMEADCNLLWGGDEHYRNRAKIAFWAGIREENATRPIQENDPQHIALLIDLWIQMGGRIKDLSTGVDGRGDYDDLVNLFIKILERLFSDQEVSAEEKLLLSCLNRVPQGSLENYFPRVSALCEESINENFVNLGKCRPFIDVFCINEKLMPDYEKKLHNLLCSDSDEDKSIAYQCLNGLGSSRLSNGIIDFFRIPPKAKPIPVIRVLSWLAPFLADDTRGIKGCLLNYLHDEEEIVREVAWKAFSQFSADAISERQDLQQALIEGLNHRLWVVRDYAWNIVLNYGADFVSGHSNIRQALVKQLSDYHVMIDGSTGVNWIAWCILGEFGADFIVKHQEIKDILFLRLGDSLGGRETILNTLRQLGADFVTENQDILQTFNNMCFYHGGYSIRWGAWDALCKFGSDVVSKHQALKDILVEGLADILSCKYAWNILNQFGVGFVSDNNDIQVAWAKCLSDSYSVSDPGWKTLRQFGVGFVDRHQELLNALDMCMRSSGVRGQKAAWETLQQFGGNFVGRHPELLSALNMCMRSSDFLTQKAAWETLQQFGGNFVVENSVIQQGLINCLSCSDGSVSRAAWVILQKFGGDFAGRHQELLNAWVTCMRSSDISVFRRSWETLQRFGGGFVTDHPEVRDALISCLSHTDYGVRSSAWKTLQQFGSDFVSEHEAVQVALFAGLTSQGKKDSGRIRKLAWKCLDHLGAGCVFENQSVLQDLIGRLNSGDVRECQVAKNILQRLDVNIITSHQDILNVLIEFVSHGDWSVRRLAWEILGQLGSDFVSANTEMRSALVTFLSSPSIARHGAMNALKQWGAELVSKNQDILEALIECLKDGHRSVYQPAWDILGQLDADVVSANKKAILDVLIPRLSDNDISMQVTAWCTLGQLGPGVVSANEAILNVLITHLSHANYQVWQVAWDILSQLSVADVSNYPAIKEALVAGLRDTDGSVHITAWRTLGQLGAGIVTEDQDIWEILIEGLVHDRMDSRQTALNTLKQLGAEVVFKEEVIGQALLEELTYENRERCQVVWDVLGQLSADYQNFQDALVECLSHKEREMCWKALQVVDHLGSCFIAEHPKFEEVIKSFLENRNPTIQKCAGEVLDKLATYRREQTANTNLTGNPNSFHAQAPAQAIRPASAAPVLQSTT